MPRLVVPPAPGRLPPRRGGSPAAWMGAGSAEGGRPAAPSPGTAGPRPARTPLVWLRAPVTLSPAALEDSKGRGQKNEIRVYCRKGRGELGWAWPSRGCCYRRGAGLLPVPLDQVSPSTGPAPQLPIAHPGRGDGGTPQPLPQLGEHASPLPTRPSPLSPPQRPPSVAGHQVPIPPHTRHSPLSAQGLATGKLR